MIFLPTSHANPLFTKLAIILLEIGCSIVEAIEAATLHPAQLMKIEEFKGTLDYGTDADLVFLTPDSLEVKSTWIAGECVYYNEDLS